VSFRRNAQFTSRFSDWDRWLFVSVLLVSGVNPER
jgi:hypothetical protein